MHGGDPIGWVVALAAIVALFALKWAGELVYVRWAQRRWIPGSTRAPWQLATLRSLLGGIGTIFVLLPFSIFEGQMYWLPGALRIATPLVLQLVMRIVFWAMTLRWAYGRDDALPKLVLGGTVVSYLLDVPGYVLSAVATLGVVVGAHISSC